MDSISPPSLGDFIRARRTRATPKHPDGMTRAQLGEKIYLSVSYIARLEGNVKDASPSPQVLDATANALCLDDAERRHLFNLARRTQTEREDTTTPWTIADYRTLITPDMKTAIAALNPHLVAYLDERWNVIDCNSAYDKAFPGLVDEGNVLRWFFSTPASMKVMVEWEAEAALTVSWFRALMGRYYNPDWAVETLEELSAFPLFRQLWSREEVRFGRHQPFMHLRDAESGEHYSVHVQVHTEMRGKYPLQMYLGVRLPAS
ncbi:MULTISPECIES: helix-turn-helix transcriptional regulator [unclassified Rhodococcus (in: high G+C Gram-positive bacteria)]|uniref:helix-turn-helix transcriptional regulator n=1 Tax=unclassified Rhodococcus (in: high G+C Gram-positive bacteria) TaxID=192944 RepID=UPI0029534932|nr:helix-turn-helix transcriptional regulator [Rhodococcus sp. IEGM 27]MDV8030787.1 helix-turn-helix transcriptional regulator [Rhodococcus sp. IEGM 27]